MKNSWEQFQVYIALQGGIWTLNQYYRIPLTPDMAGPRILLGKNENATIFYTQNESEICIAFVVGFHNQDTMMIARLFHTERSFSTLDKLAKYIDEMKRSIPIIAGMK